MRVSMGKVGGISDVMIDIQEHIDRGEMTFEAIADKLGVPIEWVEAARPEYCDDTNYEEYMDPRIPVRGW